MSTGCMNVFSSQIPRLIFFFKACRAWILFGLEAAGNVKFLFRIPPPLPPQHYSFTTGGPFKHVKSYVIRTRFSTVAFDWIYHQNCFPFWQIVSKMNNKDNEMNAFCLPCVNCVISFHFDGFRTVKQWEERLQFGKHIRERFFGKVFVAHVYPARIIT